MELGAQPEILGQEIAQLEAKLAAKKQELVSAGIETPEKNILKEVIREHASGAEGAPAVAPAPTPVASTAPATAAQVQQANALVAQAFVKGIAAAVADAQKTGDSFFVDLLHDRLADEYYAKLLTARKLKSL